MKVAICCIGRLENRYIIEYIEYYKTIGVDKIFIYDNNYDNEEYFNNLIRYYIDNKFVEIINYRNKQNCQLEAYQDCYNKYGNEYDWILFIDCGDEYLYMTGFDNIKDFLSQEKFKDYELIHINVMTYGDNNLIYYENKPLKERFKTPILPLDFKRFYDFPENDHISSIVRGKLKEVLWNHSPHTPSNDLKCCDAGGNNQDNLSSFIHPFNFTYAHFKHYTTKTIDEWCNIKYKRKFPDGNNFFETTSLSDGFFSCNEKTKEKEDYINNFLKKSKLKLFVLTYKEITSSRYDSSYMIPLYNNKCHNDMDDFNDICMHETYMIYDVYKHQDKYLDKNTKYVGFCHYRRYFDIDYNSIIDLLDNNKIILSEKQEFTESVLQQYNICHDLLDNDFKVIKTIIDNYYPEYTNDLIEFLNQNTMSACNMFICNKQIFNEYCSWLYDIIKKYFKHYNINNYGDMYKFVIEHIHDKYRNITYYNNKYSSIEYQSSIAGFLAERLINVFFLHNYKNNIEYININFEEN